MPNYTAPYKYPDSFEPVARQTIAEMTRIVDAFKSFDILGVLNPEPVTPWFKDPSSPVFGYNEDLTLLAICLVFIFILDLAIVRPFMHPKSRYFALHAVANAIVVYFATPEFFSVFTEDPATVFSGPMKTMVPTSACVALHVYHCLAFNLTAADIFHHLYFAFALCLMAIPCKNIQGSSANMGCWVLSGFPGGIDYIMLCLNYHGFMTRAQEKWRNTLINLYIRAPGTVIYLIVGYTSWLNPGIPRQQAPSFIFYVLAFIAPALHFYNGQYYCQDCVQSHHLYTLKQQYGFPKDDDKKKKEE